MCPYPHLDEDAVFEDQDFRREAKGNGDRTRTPIIKMTGGSPHLATKRVRRSGVRTVLVLTEDSQPCISGINGLSGKATSVVERLFINLRARPSLDQCTLLQQHHIQWEPLLGSSSLTILLKNESGHAKSC